MRAAFSDALVRAAQTDPKVLLLTGDHGYALFDAFRRECPDQYVNCGIAEQNMIGVAAGLAKGGFRPIVYGLAAFVPIRVVEQIKIDVCYEGLPVILIGDGAGVVYSHLGASHQSTEDIASVRSIPGLTILSPADRFEMTASMDLALQLDSPVYVRIGKSDLGDVHNQNVSFGSGDILQVRPGNKKIALIATGSMVKSAISLCDGGLDAEVWSVPSIKPLDRRQLNDIASRVACIVTLEEHSVLGGLGAAVAEHISNNGGVPLCRIGVADVFSAKAGDWRYLMNEHRLDVPSIQLQVENFLAELKQE